MPHARIEILDYQAVGRKVVEWAKDSTKRPTTIADFKAQLDQIAIVPDRIKTITFVQPDLENLILRLPDREMFQDSKSIVDAMASIAEYPLPQFYSAAATPEELQYSRIGDYTIAQCM